MTNFNKNEFYQISPNDRFCMRVYEKWKKIDDTLTDTQYLRQIQMLEKDLSPMYTPEKNRPINPEEKPYSAGYKDWVKKLEEKIRKDKINNPFAIAQAKHEQLMMIINENGLIGGNDRAGTGVVTEGDKLDIEATEE